MNNFYTQLFPSNEANFYDVGPFTFTVGAHAVRSDRVWVVMRDYPNGGDYIEIRGYEPVIDGTLFAQGYFGVRLSGTPGTNVFRAAAPEQFEPVDPVTE